MQLPWFFVWDAENVRPLKLLLQYLKKNTMPFKFFSICHYWSSILQKENKNNDWNMFDVIMLLF